MDYSNISSKKKLIAKALLGEISEEENVLLNAWLDESAEHRVLYESMKSREYLQNAIGDHNSELRHKGWEQLENRILAKKRHRIRTLLLRVAAVVAFPLLAGGAAWFLLRSDVESRELASTDREIKVERGIPEIVLADGKRIGLVSDTVLQEGNGRLVNQRDTLHFVEQDGDSLSADSGVNVIRIPRGCEYTVCLEDGTTVYLNAESELQVPTHFSARKRTVWLKGEAYFCVNHDRNRTFTVKTEKADIMVLGTEFCVRTYSDEEQLQATLVKGSVQVSNANGVRCIIPGEQAQVDGNGETKVEKVNIEQYIAWKLGRMMFVDARLEDIMRNLERWYDLEISYQNPEMKAWRFTIDIEKYVDVSEILLLMEKTWKMTFSAKGKKVLLRIK